MSKGHAAGTRRHAVRYVVFECVETSRIRRRRVPSGSFFNSLGENQEARASRPGHASPSNLNVFGSVIFPITSSFYLLPDLRPAPAKSVMHMNQGGASYLRQEEDAC